MARLIVASVVFALACSSSNGGAAGTSGGAAGAIAPAASASATPAAPAGSTASDAGGAKGSTAGHVSAAGRTGGTSGGASGANAASGAGGTTATKTTGASGASGMDGASVATSCQLSCGSVKWACWPMPNPVGSGLPNPASYADQGEVVHDNVTCLDWQKAPPAETYTFEQAVAYCGDLVLGGHDDWRLPTRIELTSIVDFTKSPAIDKSAFPGAASGFHKTASDWILTIKQIGAGAGKDLAWAFNLSDGIVSNAYSKATAARLRCVRGAEGEAPSAPAVAPANHYAQPASGEVRDNYTGLVWQQGASDAGMTFAEAKNYCAALSLNAQSWRLPSIRELATLVDEAQVAPAIDRTLFPNTKYGSKSNNWYWASHPAVNNAQAAWAINFDDGFTGFNAGASGAWNYWTSAFVKCVR